MSIENMSKKNAEFWKAGNITVMQGQPTLRDQFAMAALPVAAEYWKSKFEDNDETAIARTAYHFADAMLKARGNTDE